MKELRIGIDLGGTNIAAGLVDDRLHVVDRMSVKTNAPRPMEGIIADMVRMTRELCARNGLSASELDGVGVGVPCTANQQNGCMEDANNLGIDDAPLIGPLSEQLGVPVHFDNDANAAAWGEYVTGGYAEDSFLMMTIGTGIGGGIILDGKIWAGINGAAGEFGHMTLRMGGEPCSCGRRGCFEAMASANALIAQARDAMKDSPDSALWTLCGGDIANVEAKTVFDAAAAGDQTAGALIDAYTTILAEGAANLINIFAPAVLCVGGGVSRAGEALMKPLREKTARLICSKNAKRSTVITAAKLDNDAGIVGAALLGMGRQTT